MSTPLPPVRRAKKPQPAQNVNPVKIATGVVGVLLLGTLASLWPSGSSSGPRGWPSSSLDRYLEENHVSFSGVKILCDDKCVLYANRPIQAGEVIAKVPADAILEPSVIMSSDIGKIIAHDNYTIIKKHSNEERLGPAFSNMFAYSFFLALHRKDPNSQYKRWLDSFPTSAGLGGSLFWEEQYDKCIDHPVAAESASIRSILEATVACAKELCDTVSGACPNGVPTEADLRWAMGTYLHRNYQDQAIIPGADFAVVDNSRPGITPQFNQEERVLEMRSSTNYKKGDTINVNFARGPGTLLVSQGWFDHSSVGVDSRIRLQDDGDKLKKKYCMEKFSELLFTTAGYPRDALVNCIAVLVASPDMRRDIKKNVKTNKQLRSHVWGNLTGLLQHSLQDQNIAAISLENTPQCFDTSVPLVNVMAEYREFTKSALQSNFQYCQKKWVEVAGPEVLRQQIPTQAPGGSVTINPDGTIGDDEAPESP